ncbi:hypothetical protein BDW66DRAFT_29009 [Aspergillus desertorum]
MRPFPVTPHATTDLKDRRRCSTSKSPRKTGSVSSISKLFEILLLTHYFFDWPPIKTYANICMFSALSRYSLDCSGIGMPYASGHYDFEQMGYIIGLTVGSWKCGVTE